MEQPAGRGASDLRQSAVDGEFAAGSATGDHCGLSIQSGHVAHIPWRSTEAGNYLLDGSMNCY